MEKVRGSNEDVGIVAVRGHSGPHVEKHDVDVGLVARLCPTPSASKMAEIRRTHPETQILAIRRQSLGIRTGFSQVSFNEGKL